MADRDDSPSTSNTCPVGRGKEPPKGTDRTDKIAKPAPAKAFSTPLSWERFAQGLDESGLMTAEQIRAFHDSLSAEVPPHNAESLVNELIRAEKLTPYQVGRIREGKVRGLTIAQYAILEPIGSGGMGQVFKARHRSMDRIVALKVLPGGVIESPNPSADLSARCARPRG